MSPETPAAATLATPGPVPDAGGHFGIYGGRFAPEPLMAALAELTDQYLTAKADPQFQAELADLLRGYAGGVMARKRFRENPVDTISPPAIVFDDLIGDLGHGAAPCIDQVSAPGCVWARERRLEI